ncbi:nucleotidyltransferase substrate binding protein, HI0074 family [Geoalkalibacter ferrihydriticus]|uniref:Nucleotidyltransferase substrate binding protein, HI0074 family n=1 Tax=Geoalkalibacter ferrihydriticus TaxID=392333 RepID=A0A1G9VRE3_9BACT|nr:HI0074 family nucleotidyltransferase substrate-binding subunit [Geoalkalibacter ferrihydriticus]SDM74774.1 nucleotidyltransferase substrate binding protein, HI0074 family [Geoalkalibacter ferrihydriticus]
MLHFLRAISEKTTPKIRFFPIGKRELAWNVLKDYLEEMGISGIIGSKGATLEAFQNGLIEDGEAWMEMIRARILSPHTYNPQTAEKIVGDILTSFYPAFEQLAQKLPTLAESSGNN